MNRLSFLFLFLSVALIGCNKFGGMTKVAANSTLGTSEFYIDTYEASFAAKEVVSSDGKTKTTEQVATSIVAVAPAASIAYADAKAACEKADKRICAYKEWVAACKGPNNKKFGFQDSATSPKDITKVCDVARTENNTPGSEGSKTGSHADCKTETLEIYDMIGNLTEWTLKGEVPIAAGAAFYQTAIKSDCDATLTAGEALTMPADTATSDLGFRCCKSVDK